MSFATPEDEIRYLAARLDELVGDARQGLPQEVFFLASRLTPMVNVDLLIRNPAGQTLLTWRADAFYGPGWHVPGGIVRFKESLGERIAAVAGHELGCTVQWNENPLALRQIRHPQRATRGHFLSLLYACELRSAPDPELKFTAEMPKNGQWMWHDRCPESLITVHQAYRPWIDGTNPTGFFCLSA